MRGQHFQVWFDVPAWKKKTYMTVTRHDIASGTFTEAPRIELGAYEDVFPLAATLSVTDGVLNIKPRASYPDSYLARHGGYRVPFRIPLTAFVKR